MRVIFKASIEMAMVTINGKRKENLKGFGSQVSKATMVLISGQLRFMKVNGRKEH